MPNYRDIYRISDARLRVPFVGLGMFLRVEGIQVSIAEARAIENVATFAFSVGILSRRLKSYLDAYRAETWADVPIHELFLDTQGFFLFVQQFLEDLTLIIRMSLPHSQRHQMPAAFSHFIPRLRQQVLAADAPLESFLATEQSWFDDMKDLRDDILHRTAFGQNRGATFPDLVEVLRAGGGHSRFVGGTDLCSYVGGVLVRVFALACLADDFVRDSIRARHPNASMSLRSGILFAADEIDLGSNEVAARFEPGTLIVTISREAYEALEFFIEAGLMEIQNSG
jgi:hypothetical protein